MAHQIPSAPAVGAFDGLLQLLIGEVQESLIGPPGFAFFVEEGQTVGIHVPMVAPGAPVRLTYWLS